MKPKLFVLVMVAVVLLGGCVGLDSNKINHNNDISTDTQTQTDAQQTPLAQNTQQRETVIECNAQQTATPTPTPTCNGPRESADSKPSSTASAETSPTDTPSERSPTDDGMDTPLDDGGQADTPPSDDGDDTETDGTETETPVNDDGSDDSTDTPPTNDESDDGSKTDTPANGSDDDRTVPTNGTVALDNVTAEGICTDYKANRATFTITNHDDDTAIVYYMAADAAGGGGVTIAPGESVRVDDIDTTSIATGLEQGAITLFIKNAPGLHEQGINYPSDPSPCGDTLPTHPDIVFTNQTTFDSEQFAVTLTEVTLPEGGFVVFSNESGAIVETSYYIGLGIAHQVDIDFYRAFTTPEASDQLTVAATLYRDTNDNGAFDPAIDHPYTSTAGNTSATATVTYGGDHP